MIENVQKRKSSSKFPNQYRYNEELNCYEIIFTTPKHKNQKCLIDKEDYDFCRRFHWQVSNSGYVFTMYNYSLYYLHKEVIGGLPNETVDHQNGNTFDNRKENLRKCNTKENVRNRHVFKSNTDVLGVRKDKRCKNSYRSQIYFESNKHIEKTYRDKELAIIQRLCWEIMYFGEFAPQIDLIKEKYSYLMGYFQVRGKMVFNDDIERVKSVGDCLLNDIHCPCSLIKNDNTICPCLPCRKVQKCHCEIFKPISEDNNILKYKYPDIYNEWLNKEVDNA